MKFSEVTGRPLRITGRVENKNGANTHYRLNKENILTRQLAVDMCKEGFLKDYEIYPIEGVEYLRGKPNTVGKDNIDKQPLFTFNIKELS